MFPVGHNLPEGLSLERAGASNRTESSLLFSVLKELQASVKGKEDSTGHAQAHMSSSNYTGLDAKARRQPSKVSDAGLWAGLCLDKVLCTHE